MITPPLGANNAPVLYTFHSSNSPIAIRLFSSLSPFGLERLRVRLLLSNGWRSVLLYTDLYDRLQRQSFCKEIAKMFRCSLSQANEIAEKCISKLETLRLVQIESQTRSQL